MKYKYLKYSGLYFVYLVSFVLLAFLCLPINSFILLLVCYSNAIG